MRKGALSYKIHVRGCRSGGRTSKDGCCQPLTTVFFSRSRRVNALENTGGTTARPQSFADRCTRCCMLARCSQAIET